MSVPLYILAIPLLPLAAFVLTLFLGPRLGERGEQAHWPPIVAVVASFVCALIAFFRVRGGVVIDQDLYTWIQSGDFKVSVGFLVDQLTAVMLLVVTSVSALVHIYSVGYMKGEAGYARFFAYLSLFTFSMLMLVMGNNFMQLFFGWEAVGLSSYLLIGFYFEKKSAADAGKKAFIVNRFGDFGFLLGMLCLFTQFGSLHYSEIFAKAPQIANLAVNICGLEIALPTLIALLLFCGAIGKSAQIPLHVWLPDAMEGPTPVSALIHAATMVTAGVFLVARCQALFVLSPLALNLITVLGAVTALFAATIALVQTDIKRVVAYSTVSQLAYMFMACGVGACAAGIFHLFTHAFFKALLFLGCGSVILAMHHEQDLQYMGGLKKWMPVTYLTFLAASLSISGIPPFAGFFSKDEILLMAYASGTPTGQFAYIVGLLVAFLTAFYSFRLLFLVFHGEFRGTEEQRHHLRESPKVVLVPLILLACGAIGAGWFGVPEVLGGSNRWAGFLEPVLGHASAHLPHVGQLLAGYLPAAAVSAPPNVRVGELELMVFSVAAGVLGILLAWFMYRLWPSAAPKLAGLLPPAHRLLLRKYYVDELYQRLVVEPALWLARNLLLKVVDLKAIEGVVNGLPHMLGRAGRRLGLLQDGLVSHYLAWMGGGAVALVALLLVVFVQIRRGWSWICPF